MSIEFEWDEQKRLSNLQKHGIDFIRACHIFSGFTVEGTGSVGWDRWLEKLILKGLQPF